MMDKFLDGSLEKFDFVFTYSSVEHTGLGKSHYISDPHLYRIVNNIPKFILPTLVRAYYHNF